MGDQTLEAVSLAGDPVGQVSTIAATAGTHARAVCKGIGGEYVVYALHYVVVGLATPVLQNLVDELLPKTGRSAPVDRNDHVTRTGKHLGIPAETPGIVIASFRAAVQNHCDWILLRCVKIWRAEQPSVNLGAACSG